MTVCHFVKFPKIVGAEAFNWLEDTSFEEILKRYHFVNDFKMEEAERDISKGFYWRYPYPLPKATFPINHQVGETQEELPSAIGNNRPVQHLNFGKILFLDKKYEEARKVWLTARSTYGTTYPYHRRNDYFIGLAYLKISKGVEDMLNGDFSKAEVRLSYSNAATFLSWAFIRKKDLADPELEQFSPQNLYNLAAIYYAFDHYSTAHSTALEGLKFLRLTGRKEYRGEFRRIISETWIRDRQYLKAVRELDTIIRQELNPGIAAHAFARIGDIYFDLNKYELAEEAYHISQIINKDIKIKLPLSFILRGESLFWMGKFSEAQKLIQFGLESISHKHSTKNISNSFKSWGKLRIADAYLARYEKNKNQKDLLDKAILSYYKVHHEFPNSEAAKIAQVRRACLSLPSYQKNNVSHARDTLNQARSDLIPTQAIELAWNCEVLSYGRRHPDENFIQRVKEFYIRFPNSDFIWNYIPILKDVKASHLDTYLNGKDYKKAILFYENNRDKLFSDLNIERKIKLFESYIEIKRTEDAEKFWVSYKDHKKPGLTKFLYSILFLSEMNNTNQDKYANEEEISNLISNNNEFLNKFNNTPLHLNYIHRIINTKTAQYHIPWIYESTKKWGQDNAQILCEINYPILSKWHELNNDFQQSLVIWKEISTIINDHFPAFFDKSTECSEAILNLESKIGNKKENYEEYANKWLKRFDWPQTHLIAPLMWQAAESIFQFQGANSTSKKIWSFLSSLDQNEIIESKYAKARLDTKRTENEKLWQ